jgi:HPt (histidine-containing phosphotransfer) domain-containing protein
MNAEPETRGPINERALKDIFGDDDIGFKEILNDFIEPARATIQEIYAAHKERSAEAVRQSSHKFKSAALSVGAEELGELCRTLEAAAAKGEWETIDQEVARIDALMRQVEAYIADI